MEDTPNEMLAGMKQSVSADIHSKSMGDQNPPDNLGEMPKPRLDIRIAPTSNSSKMRIAAEVLFVPVLATGSVYYLLGSEFLAEAFFFCKCYLAVVAFGALAMLADRKSPNDLLPVLVGGDYWAHWRVSDDQLQRVSARRRRRTRYGPVWVIVFAFMLGVGAGSFNASRRPILPDNPDRYIFLYAATYATFAACCGIYVFTGKRWRSILHDSLDTDVVIGPKGIYICGEFHAWGSYGFGLNHVFFSKDTPDQLQLEFFFRHGSNFTLAVPFPAEQQASALKTASMLTKRLSAERQC